MSPESKDTKTGRAPFVSLLYRVMFFLAALVVARFVLEVAGVPKVWTQYVSSMAGLFLAAIYVAAIAPLRSLPEACIWRPRSRTSRTASDREIEPAATRAEYWPMEWPAQ